MRSTGPVRSSNTTIARSATTPHQYAKATATETVALQSKLQRANRRKVMAGRKQGTSTVERKVFGAGPSEWNTTTANSKKLSPTLNPAPARGFDWKNKYSNE